MKTPEDVINRFINEENVKFNQESDDWMIEAMEEYAKLYHESMVKKLNIPAVMGELTCDSCGCHPNTMYQTSKGRFCERCKPAS